MRHVLQCVASAARHPKIAALGAREFKSGFGMTYDVYFKSEAYDAGRELAHIASFRRWDW